MSEASKAAAAASSASLLMWRVLVLLVLVGFDHARHAAMTQDALTCVQCHPTTKTSLQPPSHATCFGKCHGATPTMKMPASAGREGVCRTCHTPAALAGDPAGFRARPSIDADFVLVVGHKRHAPIACAACHPAKPAAPHARCATCHVGTPGKGPPLSLCTSCHVLGEPIADKQESRVLVRTAFSHARHAARGAKCAACHATDTDARTLPPATAPTCAAASCHDAKAAFPITEACTRCHQDVPAIKFVVPRPVAAFSHVAHLPIVAFVTCSTCHPIAKSGEVGLAGHAPCASCHAEDFGSRTPRTCGACHDATEPWRKLVPDRPSLPKTDFGASLDHAKHSSTCASCHVLTTAATELRPPRGHAACSGASCHAVAGGPAPAFTSCGGCHELGLADQREAQRRGAKWSVRARFTHAKHERASDGNALPCVACHLDMHGTDLMSLATPPKSACAPCHDGRTSFKLTGTGCKRCHE